MIILHFWGDKLSGSDVGTWGARKNDRRYFTALFIFPDDIGRVFPLHSLSLKLRVLVDEYLSVLNP